MNLGLLQSWVSGVWEFKAIFFYSKIFKEIEGEEVKTMILVLQINIWILINNYFFKSNYFKIEAGKTNGTT